MRDIELLLSMDGVVMHREDGYWWKIEAKEVAISNSRPAGVKYSLTLHDKNNLRVFGYDNAHLPKSRPSSRPKHSVVAHDHMHKSEFDKGTIYTFNSCSQLLEDFFVGVDSKISELIQTKGDKK